MFKNIGINNENTAQNNNKLAGFNSLQYQKKLASKINLLLSQFN
jgi:hypothetical protein